MLQVASTKLPANICNSDDS